MDDEDAEEALEGALYADEYPKELVIGKGRTGIVIHGGDGIVYKIPLRRLEDDLDTLAENLKSLVHEMNVYQRLGRCEFVVPMLDFSENTLALKEMVNGNLITYQATHTPASKGGMLLWFRQMARGLDEIHHKGVLVVDIAQRNFLIDRHLAIKYCDFANAIIFDEDIDMEVVEDEDYTVQTEIGQLGVVMWEVITGERTDFYVFKDLAMGSGDLHWPRRYMLPSTQGLWLQNVIDRCWAKNGLGNAKDLFLALDAVAASFSKEDEESQGSTHVEHFGQPISLRRRELPSDDDEDTPRAAPQHAALGAQGQAKQPPEGQEQAKQPEKGHGKAEEPSGKGKNPVYNKEELQGVLEERDTQPAPFPVYISQEEWDKLPALPIEETSEAPQVAPSSLVEEWVAEMEDFPVLEQEREWQALDVMSDSSMKESQEDLEALEKVAVSRVQGLQAKEFETTEVVAPSFARGSRESWDNRTFSLFIVATMTFVLSAHPLRRCSWLATVYEAFSARSRFVLGIPRFTR
ncbi:kinase-like domain-containing protein [Aspergillus multicolor]|uniref:kinase-like domain-containing protein n=1 Tax=Aspergillus multicolor TaxID=41759 RepID=UPI003CCD1B42